jgi:hypothetical protein
VASYGESYKLDAPLFNKITSIDRHHDVVLNDPHTDELRELDCKFASRLECPGSK